MITLISHLLTQSLMAYLKVRQRILIVLYSLINKLHGVKYNKNKEKKTIEVPILRLDVTVLSFWMF